MVSGLQEGAATGALAVSALSAGWLTGALVSRFLLRSGSGAITAELALAALALASAADVLGAEADLGVTGQPVVDGFRVALATAAGISAVVFALFVRSTRRSRTVPTPE